jgi:hypothetical protein
MKLGRVACRGLVVASFLISPVLHAEGTRPISYDGRTVLIGNDASLQGGLKQINMGRGKVGWIDGWKKAGAAVSWVVSVERPAVYKVSAIVESPGHGCSISLKVDAATFSAACAEQGWSRVSLSTLKLTAGRHTIEISSNGTAPPSKLFSLEFERPDSEAALAKAAKRESASTRWMVESRYGLMFHWTSQSQPREGPPKPYCDAVRDFDVNRFATMVSESGAGFVIFTTSHAGFYFPGPNPVIDRILPGRTCPRDLVRDLADALAKHHIRLELYFHPGHDDAPWWQRTHFDEPDKTAYFQQWRDIIAQIGRQYGPQLAGFWFDDAAFTYYPFNPSWDDLAQAARTGNPNRVLTFNSWILPKLSDFYDVYAGENAGWDPQYQLHNDLPVGGTGRYTGGPQQGLQAEVLALLNDDWGHFKPNQAIGPPRISTPELITRMRDSISRNEVPILDVEVYQDGTIGPETFAQLRSVGREFMHLEH